MTNFIYDLPDWGVVALIGALLALAVWVTWKAMPYWRAMGAMGRAVEADAATGVAGVVKVRGQAHAAEIPEGFGAPEMVWREQSSYSGVSGRVTGTKSVARIVVRDGTGEFLIHAEEALVVPTGLSSKETRRIFGDSSRTTTRFIRTGDEVIVIGLLGDKRMKPGREGEPRRLRRTAEGVLLLSGRDEARTMRSLRWRVVPAMVVAGTALAMAGWVWWVRPVG